MTPTEYRAIVDGMPEGSTEQDLRELFEPFGKVVFVRICSNKQTGLPTGAGRVSMLDPEHVAEAIKVLHNSAFRSSVLTVRPGVHFNAQQPCRSFNSKGGCKFGDRCRYSHAEAVASAYKHENDTGSQLRHYAPNGYKCKEPLDLPVRNIRQKKYRREENIGIHMFTSEYGDMA